MLAGNFGAEALSEFTVSHFWQALTSPTVNLAWHSASPDRGRWQGTHCYPSGGRDGDRIGARSGLVHTSKLPPGSCANHDAYVGNG